MSTHHTCDRCGAPSPKGATFAPAVILPWPQASGVGTYDAQFIVRIEIWGSAVSFGDAKAYDLCDQCRGEAIAAVLAKLVGTPA